MKCDALLMLVLLGVGCGRFGFQLHADAKPDGRPYGGLDASPPFAAPIDAGCTACESDSALGPLDAGESESDGASAITAPTVTWTSDTNLSFDNTLDHSCAEGGDMVSYAVVSLVAGRATLDHVPDAGCLAAGDEVLLIAMQGVGTANMHVGQFEILRLGSLQGADVIFQNPKQLVYGAGVNDDNIGTAPGQQRVVLQRVPTYGNATLTSGATLRTYAWDGKRGGVIAMRVQGELRIDGRIDVSGTGYAGAPRTQPVSTTGEQGESIGGLGNSDVNANQGGGGGGLGDGNGCRQSGSGGGGAGHALTGAAGVVLDCSAVGGGAAGAETGGADRMLLGSGGGAGGTDNVRTDNPPGGRGGNGGGIVLLIAKQLTGAGSIESAGSDGEGDAPGVECNDGSASSCWDHSGPGGGGAGGTLRIEAASVASSITFALQGGDGGNGHDSLAGNGGSGSAGRLMTIAQP